MNDAEPASFIRIDRTGARDAVTRPIANEGPVAIECNGIGYAVLMASPGDLVDLAYGFALSERLVTASDEILAVEVSVLDHGVIVRLDLAREAARRIADRVRHRTADSSCGLCGVESLEQAMRPLPRRGDGEWRGDDAAVFRALAALESSQPLGATTRAVHAAAACDRDGGIRLVREDVGRHNAFDKLIGAMQRSGTTWDGGFALLTSRCSYELVEKAVLADCPMLATISAPTGLALDRARSAGLALRVLARPDAMLALPGAPER